MEDSWSLAQTWPAIQFHVACNNLVVCTEADEHYQGHKNVVGQRCWKEHLALSEEKICHLHGVARRKNVREDPDFSTSTRA